MAKVLLPLIVASGLVTSVTAWGFGRTAFDGRRIIHPSDSNAMTFSPKTEKQMSSRRLTGRCWIGAGVSVDNNYVWFSDFCGNNGYLTRCPKFDYNFNRCSTIRQMAGYGGFGMTAYGPHLNYLGRAARDSGGSPSNSYSMANMKYFVYGSSNGASRSGYCYFGHGIVDLQLMHPSVGYVLFLKEAGGNTAQMSVCRTQGVTQCGVIRNHNVATGCPGKPKGVTYAAARRRYGFLYFSCNGYKNMMKKRKFNWSNYYPGMLGSVKGPKTTTTTSTTTTTTPVPITMKTWSFPEGLSWSISKGRKTVCRGGRYTDWYTSLKVTGCKLSQGWYKVTCKDRFKEGWRGAYLQIKNHKLCHKKYEWGKGPVWQAKFFIRK
jgi:hypothetical protein